MVNEATLVMEIETPLPFTVSNTVGIEKGTLLKMSDPLTVAASTALLDTVGGIAAQEKIASDGVTKLGVYRKGWFKVFGSGTITVGDPVAFTGSNNEVISRRTTLGVSGSKVLGIALETSADAETLLIELAIGGQTG